MKVAYNSCFGGFGLSPKALTEFAKRKGITLTWYKQVGYNHNSNERYVRVDDLEGVRSFNFYALTCDLGGEIQKIPSKNFYYPNFDELRCDEDLIYVLELLGDKASGECADIKIDEIPDGATYEITDYDGMESVEPPRASW